MWDKKHSFHLSAHVCDKPQASLHLGKAANIPHSLKKEAKYFPIFHFLYDKHCLLWWSPTTVKTESEAGVSAKHHPEEATEHQGSWAICGLLVSALVSTLEVNPCKRANTDFCIYLS